MRHCIESILPGGDDVEILIVNDGSNKDNTLEIAKEYERISDVKASVIIKIK